MKPGILQRNNSVITYHKFVPCMNKHNTTRVASCWFIIYYKLEVSHHCIFLTAYLQTTFSQNMEVCLQSIPVSNFSCLDPTVH